MDPRENSPRTEAAPIVVGVDRSAAALSATRWAAEQAQSRKVPLVLVHAAPYLTAAAPGEKQPRQRARGILARAWTEAVRHAPGVQGRTELTTDDPATALVRFSAGARLLVLGLPGSGGIDELQFGSAIAGVAEHAGCPVVGVRTWPLPDTGEREIVVGVRDVEGDAAVIDSAFQEAERRGRGLLVLHCGAEARPESPEERQVRQQLDGWRRRHPDVQFRYQVEPGAHAALAILCRSHDAELIVVGRHAKGPIARALLGSTSRALLRHSQVPVWVLDRAGSGTEQPGPVAERAESSIAGR